MKDTPRFAIVVLLTALCSIWLTGNASIPLNAQPGHSAGLSNAQSRDCSRELHETVKPAKTIEEKFFPDGTTWDFGKVQRGTPLYHAFRIVNTSNMPLRIVSLSMS